MIKPSIRNIHLEVLMKKTLLMGVILFFVIVGVCSTFNNYMLDAKNAQG